MIWDRWYEPTENELIFHYCRAESFLAIVKNKSLWLSAYYTLNDASERNWGYSIFERVAKNFQADFGAEFTRHATSAINAGVKFSLLMFCSFSLDPDVLSQWRAYGDDGRGFAVGFSPNLLKLPAKQLRVLYDEGLQIKELTGNLRHIYEVEKSKGFKYDDEFRSHVFHIGLDLCAYKNRSFSEEKEIRLAHVSALDPASRRIAALGARDSSGKRINKPVPIQFRLSRGLVVPYIEVDYSNRGTANPIKEVVLGPRNENDELSIEVMLNTLRVSGVNVRRSTIPYRG